MMCGKKVGWVEIISRLLISYFPCYDDLIKDVFLITISVVESAAGVVASAKSGAEMIEDSSKYECLFLMLKTVTGIYEKIVWQYLSTLK